MKRFLLGHNPVFLALLLAVFLLPFAQVKVLLFDLPLYLHEIAITVAFSFFLPSLFKGKRADFFLRDGGILLGAILFFSGAALSFFTNPFSLTGLGMLKSWFLFPFLAGWLIFSESRTPEKREAFFSAWFLTLLFTALGSLIFLLMGELTYDHRLSGLYDSPNFLAIFLAPAPLLALYLSFLPKESGGRSLFWSTLLFFGSLSVLIVLFFTRSYGVWGALLSATIFFLFGARLIHGFSKKTLLLMLALFFSVGTFLFFEQGSEKWQAMLSFDDRSSFASRLMIWQAAVKIFSDNAVFGIGVGRFQAEYLEYQQYFPPYLEWAVPEPHNLYLAVLLATGLIGCLGFLILVGRFGYLAIQALLSETDEARRLTSALTLTLLFLTLVYGMTDTPYFKNDLALSFMLILALGLSTLKSQEKKSSPQE